MLGLRAVVGGPVAYGDAVRLGRRTTKGVAGLDLVGLFVGSEGTLAFCSLKGQVYLAKDTALNREVAIKVLNSDLSRNPELVERFRSELSYLATYSEDRQRALARACFLLDYALVDLGLPLDARGDLDGPREDALRRVGGKPGPG